MKLIDKLLNGSKTIVFLDFEGTQISQEIIAIGAVKVTLDKKNNIKKILPGFKCFVKSKDKVGKIITKLTGITDVLLSEEGLLFKEAIIRLEKYCRADANTKYVSYGNFDMRLLHQSATINNLNDDKFIRSIYKNYFDFSALLIRYVQGKKGGQLSLLDALKTFGIQPEGNAHDPLFDAKNLALLYQGFLQNHSKLVDEYYKVLTNNSRLPHPIGKTISTLNKNGTVTKKEFIKFIEEDLY
ncbi:MAG: 3'-5' exonuclease [Bacilli bacterium]